MAVGADKTILNRSYPSKVLLFGEHLVLDGASCLAIPFPKYKGHWVKGIGKESLDLLISHVADLPFIDRELLQGVYKNKYFLKSDIPRGYGLGSSGALCAAIYELVCPHYHSKSNETVLKELASIENFFHGQSSGLDAYVSLVNCPIKYADKKIEQIDIDLSDWQKELYLLDSGISRSSKNLINKFVNDFESSKNKKRLIAANDQLIAELSSQNHQNIENHLQIISEIQFEILDYMIVDSVKSIWAQSLETSDYYIKLCGAGGGGYYLVYGEPSVIESLNADVIPLNG